MLPPFTDLRSVQTLVDADKLEIALRRPGPLGARLGRLHRRDLAGRCWPSSAAPTSRSATPSGASTTREPTSSSTPRSRRPSGTGSTPILCVGEGSRSARRARTSRTRSRSSTARSPASGRAGAHDRRRLRAGLGDRHRRGRRRPRTRRRCCGAIRTRLAELYAGDAGRRGPRALRRLGEGRRTSRRSWPSRTSTARSSAARASTPRSSPRSPVPVARRRLRPERQPSADRPGTSGPVRRRFQAPRHVP